MLKQYRPGNVPFRNMAMPSSHPSLCVCVFSLTTASWTTPPIPNWALYHPMWSENSATTSYHHSTQKQGRLISQGLHQSPSVISGILAVMPVLHWEHWYSPQSYEYIVIRPPRMWDPCDQATSTITSCQRQRFSHYLAWHDEPSCFSYLWGRCVSR